MKLNLYKGYIEHAANVPLETFLHYPLDKQLSIIRLFGAAEQIEFVVSDTDDWSTIISMWEKKALELCGFIYNQYTKGVVNSSIDSVCHDYQLISQFSISLLCCTQTSTRLGKIRRLALALLYLAYNPEQIEANYSLASLLSDETCCFDGEFDFEELDEFPYMARIFDEWQEQGTQISTAELVKRLTILDSFAYSSNNDYYDPYIKQLRDKLNDIVKTLSTQNVTSENISDYTSLFEFSTSLFEGQELIDIQEALYNKLDEYLQNSNEGFNDSYLAPAALVAEYAVRERIRTGVCLDE